MEAVQLDDNIIIFIGKVPTLEIRAEIVHPSKTATFAAADKASSFRKGSPAACTMSLYVCSQEVILFFGPCSFVGMIFFAARRPTHLFLKLSRKIG